MQAIVDRILAESGFRENPYFLALRSGELAREDFLETQIQFYFAVIFFSRPMAALAAKIPTPELRVEVLRNVWEEHGEGDFRRVHGHTFLELLRRLGGVTEDEVERRALWPEVRLFNTVLVGACVLDDYLIGAGLLGMIERMFSEISLWIGRGVVARGWLAESEMIHYDLHEELDQRHSRDFFAILERSWRTNDVNRYMVEQGLWLGATVFHGLYEGLFRQRARRAYRTFAGPHSLVDFKS